MRFVIGFGRFWWDFIIGEDWKIAAGVALVLTGGALLVAETHLSDTTISLLTGAGIILVVATSMLAGARGASRRRTADKP